MPTFARRACTECGAVIDAPRKGQYQHDGDCRKRAVRSVTRIIGKELASRIFGDESRGAELPEMEPHRSRQRKVCLKVQSGEAVDTGEGQ